MFGASRLLWEASFVFSTKTEYTEDGVVRFLFLSFSTSQDWPTIGTRIYQRITNACIGNEHLCFLYSSFLFTAITVLERRCLFIDRSGKNGHGLHLYWIRDTSFYFFIMTVWMGEFVFFFLQEGKQDKDKMSIGFDTCLQIREEDMAQ